MIVQRGAFRPSLDPKGRDPAPAMLEVEQRDTLSIRFRVLGLLWDRDLRP